MTTTGLCLWSSDGEGTCFADNVDSFLLVHSFHRSLSDPASLPRWNSFGIWKVRYGACACARACLLFLRRDGCREKTLHPQSERDKCLSGKVSMSATVCVCLCGHMRERESCVSPWEIKPGHSIHHRKTLISPFDKKGIESLFWSQPHTEKTAGECYTWVSQQRFRSVCPHINTPIAIISCYLQSNIYSIHIANLCSQKNF